MAKIRQRASIKTGLPPGTIMHVGESRDEPVRIGVFQYNESQFIEQTDVDVANLNPKADEGFLRWIDIDGIYDIQLLEQIGKTFNLHPLVLSDIANNEQRTKVDVHDDFLFVVIKLIDYDDVTHEISPEQISFILTEDTVISFRENPEDPFSGVRERIRHGKGRVRKFKSDYLLYALIDIVEDEYVVILEDIGEVIENLEEEIVGRPRKKSIELIHVLKRELLRLRRHIFPLREVILKLQKEEDSLISEHTIIYLKDLYDHTVQATDAIDNFRDTLTGITDSHITNNSNNLNEVMKLLTIISTIFIPLTFIAGIYGMNFRSMPELEWQYGYFFILALMALIFALMLMYFKRKKWL